MSARSGHPPLSLAARAWLAALADPGPPRRMPQLPLPAQELAPFVDAACAHGVAVAVCRNLRSMTDAGRPDRQPRDPRRSAEHAAALYRDLEAQLVPLAAQTLLLSHHATRLAAAFRDRAIPAQLVKGPVFARRLYPLPADRSFTDIDALMPPASLAAGFAALRDLGFVPATPADAEIQDGGEHKWILPDRPFVMVELQTDLIHSANLGGGIRLRYQDLMAAGDGDAEDATALLLVAAVHGVAGHQFERLQTCVDVLQAARGAAGPIDRRRLAAVASATGATAALHSALDLVARLFAEPAAAELAAALPPVPWRRLRRHLLTPQVVLRAQARGTGVDSWRRRALRELVRRIGRATRTREPDA